MQIDFKNFFSAQYLFDKNPPIISGFLYLLILYLVFIVFAFYLWFYLGRKNARVPVYKKLRYKAFNIFFYIGILGFVLSFFEWQAFEFLSSRFVLLLLALGFILWGLQVLYYRYRIFPKEMAKYLQKKNFQKYLP